MNQPQHSPTDDSNARTGTRRRIRIGLFTAGLLGIGMVIGAAAGTSLVASAHGNMFRGHGSHDPEAMREHMQGRVTWVLEWLDATEAQESEVSAVVAELFDGVAPLVEEHRGNKRDLLAEFSSAEVDIQALEAIRVAEIATATEISLRLTEATSQVADVLTPEQRAQLVEKLSRHRRY